MARTSHMVSGAFIWRRIHSLMGLFLVVFLIEHLFINAQVAPFWGGERFVQIANRIQRVPYLGWIEVFFLGVPFLVHIVWGVLYVLNARFNALPGDGSRPSLVTFGRNQGYMWMRITSVILVVGLVLHVVQFRFLRYPTKVIKGSSVVYTVPVSRDPGLDAWAQRWKVQPEEGGVIATSQFGVALLFTVRDVFKSPLQVWLYAIFVAAAAFHAGHGLWTFMITWGILLKAASQKVGYRWALGFGAVLLLLGCMAIWGTR